MPALRFFDYASTTKCCDAAAELVHRYAVEDFGNPSSSHGPGLRANDAIQDARKWFAKTFNVSPAQVIFTGSGSESDNLAIYGVVLEALAKRPAKPPRVLCSAIEHPAVRRTVQSLAELGADVHLIPVTADGQVNEAALLALVTPETALVSIHVVNNIVGSILPVENLARLVKTKAPRVVFHSDAVQAFGKVQVPQAPSPVDLVSISAHKVSGPKGVGALIVLNSSLLKQGFRPLIWGGEQEGGFRSGTQNAGLIAGFKAGAEKTLSEMKTFQTHSEKLSIQLKNRLITHGLLAKDGGRGATPVNWNSPEDAAPHIVNLCLSKHPATLLAQLLEKKGCIVSTGSACHSKKPEPDTVLSAMGLTPELCSSALRVSFSLETSESDVLVLADAVNDSIAELDKLFSEDR